MSLPIGLKAEVPEPTEPPATTRSELVAIVPDESGPGTEKAASLRIVRPIGLLIPLRSKTEPGLVLSSSMSTRVGTGSAVAILKLNGDELGTADWPGESR